MYRERPNLKESVDLAAAEATGKNAPACLPEADNSWAGKSADSRHQPAAYDTGAASGDSVTQSRPVLDWLGKRLAITSIALATFFSYFTVHFLTGHYFWRLTDIQSTEYMNSTTDASSAGVLIAFICTARFFRAFAGLKDNPPINGICPWTAWTVGGGGGEPCIPGHGRTGTADTPGYPPDFSFWTGCNLRRPGQRTYRYAYRLGFLCGFYNRSLQCLSVHLHRPHGQ